ncbi:MAG: tetratricopeptide (TPR) repeat protein [Glaciecola sp.]|jgi:tetratricopeptide (TPR) repeat protein
MEAIITTLLVEPIRTMAPKSALILGLPKPTVILSLLAATRPCGTQVHLVTADQVRFETNRWPSEDTARLHMHTSPSRSLLSSLGPFDLALVDVEPNWWTVARAIRAVVDTNVESGQRLPVLLVPNTGWPHANRDAYGAPRSLPPDAVNENGSGGLRLGHKALDTEGGFDNQRFHALEPGGPRNGVAPAVGDGVKHVRERYESAVIPGFHGMAVLWPKGIATLRPEAAEKFRGLRIEGAMRTYLDRLEVARLQAETARLDLGGIDAAGPIARGIDAEGKSPADVHALVLALLERSRSPEAIRLLQDALTRSPEEVILWALLARTLMRLNNAPAALNAIRKAHELDQDNVQLTLEHGQIASRAPGNEEEAETAIRKAITLEPENNRAQVMLASHLRLVGQLDEAKERCQSVLQAEPDNLSALGVLGHLDALTPEQLERADGLAERSTMSSHERANVHFSLAKAFDKSGEYERSFVNAKRANDLHKVLFQTGHGAAFDAAAHRQHIDDIIGSFTRERIEELSTFGSTSRVPIIIGGLPRSGTTLTEQILASHPQVFGAGETGEINPSIRKLNRAAEGPMTYPAAVGAMTEGLIEDLASDLVERFQAYDPEASHVTDKLPMNFLNLGLYAILTPKAPMFVLERDPRDVFISSYLQGFAAPGLTYTCDQSWFAFYANERDRIVGHWLDIIPELMQVDYAALTDEQEAWSRKIVAHAGLDWDPACLDFHKTKRAIHTASATQVRQPMFKSSVQRWRNYEPWIGELLEGLEKGTEFDTPTPSATLEDAVPTAE